jgi:O-antigen/teichoic acid export membrane protein
MLGELRRLGSETAVYGLSTVVARLLNFFLLPLYTYVLAPGALGVAGTLLSYIAFFNILYSHGMDFSFLRHAKSPGQDQNNVFSTAFWSLAAGAMALSLLIHASAGPLSSLIGAPQELSGIVRYAAWIMAFDALALIPFTELRLSHRSGFYVAVKTANIVLNLLLNWIFLIVKPMGVEGIFLALLLTSVTTLILLTPVLAARLRLRFDAPLHGLLLRFALPLVPAGLASMAVQVIDRPILQKLSGNDAAGLYQANYKLGIFMMMAVNMFDAAWRPFFLERADDSGAKRLFARVLTYFCAAAAALLLAVTFFIGDLVALPLLAGRPLIHPDYWVGLSIVPVVTLGYLFNGIYVNLLAPVTLAKRTDLVAYATGLGALVNIVSNFALIPAWGLMGAAAATALAYMAMAGSLYGFGQAVYPVEYEGGRLLHIAAVAAVLAAVFYALPAAAPWGTRLARQAALLLAFPALLALTGFLKEEEKSSLRRLCTR